MEQHLLGHTSVTQYGAQEIHKYSHVMYVGRTGNCLQNLLLI